MLESLNQTLTDLLGPMGPLLALGGVGLLLIFLALPTMLKKEKDPLDKIRAQRTGKVEQAAALRRGGKSPGAEKLDRFASYLEPKTAEELSATRLRLLRLRGFIIVALILVVLQIGLGGWTSWCWPVTVRTVQQFLR